MPMSTPSGQKTYKYDQVVPDQVKERLDKQGDVINEFQQYKIKNDERIEELMAAKEELTQLITTMQIQMEKDQIEMQSLVSKMCLSKFFRFLNAIFGWYIYGNDWIHVNCVENEKYGHPPLSTRVSRWLKRTFLERPASWMHTIFTKEPTVRETTTREEYTNDEERVQPPEEQSDP